MKSEGKQTEGQPFVHPPPPDPSILMSDISPQCSECFCAVLTQTSTRRRRLPPPSLSVGGEGKSKTSTRRATCGPLSCSGFTGFSSVLLFFTVSKPLVWSVHLYDASSPAPWQCPAQGQIPIVESSSSTIHRLFWLASLFDLTPFNWCVG